MKHTLLTAVTKYVVELQEELDEEEDEATHAMGIESAPSSPAGQTLRPSTAISHGPHSLDEVMEIAEIGPRTQPRQSVTYE